MSKGTGTSSRLLAIGIAVIQLLDILVHAATDQLEVVRVSSNVIMLLWLAFVIFGRPGKSFVPTAISAFGLYLALNLIFLAREGLTNPEQGGGLRIALFLFVLLTLCLSFLLVIRHKNYSK